MGSGTTLIVADRMQRNAVGIDIVLDYCEAARKKLLLAKVDFSEQLLSIGAL